MPANFPKRIPMRIAISGGGPAGLFFSLLIQRGFPDYVVDVFEQNAADSTYGFRVAFFDWEFIEPLAPELYNEMVAYRQTCAPDDNMMLMHRGVKVPLMGMPSLNIARIELLQNAAASRQRRRRATPFPNPG